MTQAPSIQTTLRDLVHAVTAMGSRPAPGEPEYFEYNVPAQTLRIGYADFTPVARDVFEFEVSGVKVAQSWLKYRVKLAAGRKSWPLDRVRPERWTSEFTKELLELLLVMETTIVRYPEQAKLLEAAIASDCFNADELPTIPDRLRKPRAHEKVGNLFTDAR